MLTMVVLVPDRDVGFAQQMNAEAVSPLADFSYDCQDAGGGIVGAATRPG